METIPKNNIVFGYKMSHNQELELMEKLREDILTRYDNVSYWDSDLIQEFVHNNKLKLKA